MYKFPLVLYAEYSSISAQPGPILTTCRKFNWCELE